jgi:hypothetical protein
LEQAQRGNLSPAMEGMAEGSDKTAYPNATVIKSKNGRPIGEIYQDEPYGWGCFHYGADNGADSMSSREQALVQLKDMHDEYRQQGMAEGEKKGLYYNVNKRKAAGTSRPASNPKAPTDQAWKDAAKTAKTEGVDEGRGNPEAISKNKLVHLLKIAVANSNDRREYALMTQAKEMFGDNWADDAYEYAALHNQNLNSDTFLDANNEQMQELAGRLGIKHSDYSSTPGVTETTSSAGMATAPGVGKGPKTGTLFGGSYAPRTPFTGKKKANTSVIKR